MVYGVSFPDAFEDKLFRKVLLRQLAAVTGDFPADQVSQMVVRAFQEYTNGMVSVPGIAIMTAALASTRDGGREFQSPA